MKKLSNREKLLIYVLACFLIGFFGIYFVILPSFSSYQVVSDQASEAQFTKESMELAIDSIPATMQDRDEAATNLASLKTPFQSQLTNEGLDMLLTQLCLDYSMAPKVLAIESNGMADVDKFIAYRSEEQASAAVGTENTSTDTALTEDITATQDEAADASNTETTETITPSESADTEVSADGSETWTGVVRMELAGTQVNFYRLLDAVATRSDIIITAFTIAPEAATTGTTATTNTVPQLNGGNVAINVTFAVYMVEK